jgi:hypothetical protein
MVLEVIAEEICRLASNRADAARPDAGVGNQFLDGKPAASVQVTFHAEGNEGCIVRRAEVHFVIVE